MYEFKYPKIAELSAREIRDNIAILATSLENRLEENKNSLSEFEKLTLKKHIKHVKSGINVSININNLDNEPFDLSVVKKLIDASKEINMPLTFYVIGSSKFGDEEKSVPMSFSQNTIDNLIDLNNYLVDNDEFGLLFMEDTTAPEAAWSFEEVIKANDQIDAIVSYIKESGFTPFEASAFIHQYITTQFTYKEDLFDIYSSRSIVGVLNSDQIVCVGYSYFTKAIIDKLNMPGLECSTFTSKLTNKNNNDKETYIDLNLNEKETGHMQNLIKINDPKYKINGNYVSDACWDSRNSTFPSGKGIANFLYPVEDLLHFRAQTFDQPNEQVNKMFEMLGFKNRKIDPYALPIISNNIENSKPIPYEQYKKCLTNMFKKMSPNEKESDIKRKVDSVLEVSSMVSYMIFSKDSIGSLPKKAHEEMALKLEQYQGKGLE